MSDQPLRLRVSYHAINRGRTRLMKELRRDDVTRGEFPGDWSVSRWLRERASRAVEAGRLLTSGRRSIRYAHRGVIFVFSVSMQELVTVYLDADGDDPSAGAHRGQRRRRNRRARRVQGKLEHRARPRATDEPTVTDWEDAA